MPSHNSNKKVVWLRLTMIGLLVLSVLALLVATNSQPAVAEVDAQITLKADDTLLVRPDLCNLDVSKNSASLIRVACNAHTPTPTNTSTPTNTPTPGENETFLAFVSEPGDWVGGGDSKRYTSGDSSITPSLSENKNLLSVGISNTSDGWNLYLTAPNSQELVTGIYENATRWPFQDPSVPGLSFSGNGRGCNTLTGRFEVLEANYTEGGEIERFHATFEQHCEGFEPALFGEIQIVNPAPIAEVTPAPNQIIAAANQKSSQASAELVNAPAGKIKRKLSGGQKLKIFASTAPGTACKLELKTDTSSLVKVFCKHFITPTPTLTKTPRPNVATLYIRNSTGDQICFEVYGSGIGQKCFGGGDSLYGSFSPGTYSWRVTGSCGSLDGSNYFPKGDSLLEFYCGAASIRSRNSQIVPRTE